MPVLSYMIRLEKHRGGLERAGRGRRATPSISSIQFDPEGGHTFLVAINSYLPTIYSIHAAEPLAAFYGPGYRNVSTMKSYSFGGGRGSGHEARELVIGATSDTGSTFVWKVPEQLRYISCLKDVEHLLSSADPLERFGTEVSHAFIESAYHKICKCIE